MVLHMIFQLIIVYKFVKSLFAVVIRFWKAINYTKCEIQISK